MLTLDKTRACCLASLLAYARLLILLGCRALGVLSGEVTIPLDREIESLNVAVAAGILLERLRT